VNTRVPGSLRCLALATDAFGGSGGIAQYNRDLLAALASSRKFAAIVVMVRRADKGIDAPAGIVQYLPRGEKLGYALAALWLAMMQRPQVVVCGHINLLPLALLVAQMSKARLIVQMHGVEAWPCPDSLRRIAVEAADLVLCVSRFTRAAVLGWAALPPERVVVLPNTVGGNFAPGDGGALREELGLNGKKVLLTVARMDSRERYKGHDRVIAAIPSLVAEGQDIAYVIVGKGDDRARLAALAAAAGVAERVIFLGEVARQRSRAAYRMADLFVMPSTGEGFGIAFLEAMASGTPALGLNAGGAVDALADGELGVLTSEQDMAAEVSRFLARPKSDSGAAVALAAAVRTRFGQSVFATNVHSAILRLFSGQPDLDSLAGPCPKTGEPMLPPDPKDFRRVATRHERNYLNFLAAVCIAATVTSRSIIAHT
jgi:phosphatidylinositol alpha-1,6-mannosyltransferase